MTKKKTYSEAEYGSLLANYLKVCEGADNPDGEIARLKAHISFMEEEAKKLRESYVWVCTRLEELEKKGIK
jgi:predicted nuclease with TOPRIM domain